MKEFANDLGVRWQYCHIGEEGMPLEQFDFVSDAKPGKNTARLMMRLPQDINARLDKSLPVTPPATRVMCVTCHRVKPETDEHPRTVSSIDLVIGGLATALAVVVLTVSVSAPR